MKPMGAQELMDAGERLRDETIGKAPDGPNIGAAVLITATMLFCTGSLVAAVDDLRRAILREPKP